MATNRVRRISIYHPVNDYPVAVFYRDLPGAYQWRTYTLDSEYKLRVFYSMMAQAQINQITHKEFRIVGIFATETWRNEHGVPEVCYTHVVTRDVEHWEQSQKRSK